MPSRTNLSCSVLSSALESWVLLSLVVCYRVLLSTATCCDVLQYHCSVLQWVAVCCSVLQCAAVCCRWSEGHYRWHNSLITWLILIGDMTHSWLIHRPNMTQLTCVSWLNIHMWRDWMTGGRRRQHLIHRRDMTKLTYVWMTCGRRRQYHHMVVTCRSRSLFATPPGLCCTVLQRGACALQLGCSKMQGFCSRENITMYKL